MSFSDADLIARVLLKADQNAFGELVRRYQSPVRFFLVKMTRGDLHLADDMAQETFLRAWQKLDSFRGDAKFQTWLFGIAYNQFRTEARRNKELALEDVEDLPPEKFEGSATSSSHLRMDLDEAMKVLTTAERAAIVLCCQNGLSHEEAAKVLECPLGTVKTNVMRGKEKLRKQLSQAYQNYEPA
ncbi:MAG: sigma-70 family RNA polymerase sigma factor [Verrucomicrobiota bacterium]|nr:sigma-70 family RNA polymerase sigma factor [Verrucomicrobiota bacterium]